MKALQELQRNIKVAKLALQDLRKMTLHDHKERICHLLYRYVSPKGRADNKWRNYFRVSGKLYQQEQKNIQDIKEGIFEYSCVNRGCGRGIVICGGGDRLYGTGLAIIKTIRAQGCDLPVEWFYADAGEMTDEAIKLLETFNVECSNLDSYPELKAVKKRGYQSKAMAIACSKFQEVLFLDCDNIPIRNPSYLFELKEYKQTGALFWKDLWRYKHGPIFTGPDQRKHIHLLYGIQEPEVGEYEIESGQILIDKSRHWRGVHLFLYMNLNWSIYYKLLYGDKDTYVIAMKSCGVTPSIVETPPAAVGILDADNIFSGYGMIQHDTSGDHCFVHMTMLDLYVKEQQWTAFVNRTDGVHYHAQSQSIRFAGDKFVVHSLTSQLNAWQEGSSNTWKEILHEHGDTMGSFARLG